MKKLFLLIIFLSCLFSLKSCKSAHPWERRNIPEGEGFVIVEDLTQSLGQQGVYAYRLRKGAHFYLLIDIGFDLSIIHDEDCPSHPTRPNGQEESKNGF